MTSIVHQGRVLAWVLAALCGGATLTAQNAGVTLEREGTTVVLEPYPPNILRVTMNSLKEEAMSGPGYGIVVKQDSAGWIHETTAGDTYKSARISVFIAAAVSLPRRPDGSFPKGPRKYYGGFNRGPFMTVTGADGKPVLDMLGREMGVLNDKDDNSQLNYDRRPEDPQFYQVGATFKSPDDEHYCGLGENQEGYVDHRGHKIECWANYTAAGGASFCVPFLITNKGYGLLWDNPSKTTILP